MRGDQIELCTIDPATNPPTVSNGYGTVSSVTNPSTGRYLVNRDTDACTPWLQALVSASAEPVFHTPLATSVRYISADQIEINIADAGGYGAFNSMVELSIRRRF